MFWDVLPAASIIRVPFFTRELICLSRLPSHQVVPKNICSFGPSNFSFPFIRFNWSINCSNSNSNSNSSSNSTKGTHQAASPFDFNEDSTIDSSPKKNPFQKVYSAILQTLLKAIKVPAVLFMLFVLFWLLSMMLLNGPDPRPDLALAASGSSMGGGYSSSSSSLSSSDNNKSLAVEIFSIASCLLVLYLTYRFAEDISKLPTSLLKVQVGLSGTKQSLQRDLIRIAEMADTSTSDRRTYILKEVTQSLLQHSDCFVSGYSSVTVDSIGNGEKSFKQMSNEETLVNNINNMKMKSIMNQKAKASSNKCLVITILVAAIGVHKLPVINSGEDLKEALQKLCSIPIRKIQGVQILLRRPQNENDGLLQRGVYEIYENDLLLNYN